jgi:hypothetical protein
MQMIIKGFGVDWQYNPDSGKYIVRGDDGKVYETADPEDALTRWGEWFDLAVRRRIRKGKKNVEQRTAQT